MSASCDNPAPRAFDGIKPVVVSGLINAVLILGFVAIYGGDFSALVCADGTKIGQTPFEQINVGFGTCGYDGQYYYVLARNPWRKHDAGIDLPVYRHARIVYPALAWAISAGDPTALLYTLPIVNWLALVGISWLGTALARHYQRSAWWGCLLPFVLNATSPAFRDLTDSVAMLTACSVVAAWLLGWRAWSFIPLCTLAIFSREQNLLVVLLVLFESLVSRRFQVTKAVSVSLVLGLAWLCLLRGVYGEWPVGAGNTEAPLAGILYRLQHMTEGNGVSSSWVNYLGMITVALQMGCCVALTVLRGERLSCLLALAGLTLALLSGTSIYMGIDSYTRVFWWMPFAVWLWCVQTGRVWPAVLVSVSIAWPCYALAQAWHKVQHGNVMILN